MKERPFFTPEMGLRFKNLRVEARLSQDDVADRMGLMGKHRKMTVWKLEQGRIGNPSLAIVARFLRACGARWYEISDLLMVPEKVVIDLKPIEEAGFDPVWTRRVKQDAERQIREFERKLGYPDKARPDHPRPEHPARQRLTVQRLCNYRIVANIIEMDVKTIMRKTTLSFHENCFYQGVSRQALRGRQRITMSVQRGLWANSVVPLPMK